MITPATIIRVSPNVRFRNLRGEGVALNQRTAEIMVLNEVATRLFELFDGQTSVEELVCRLQEEYEVEPRQLRLDVLRYLEGLAGHGLVEIAERGDAHVL